MGSLTMVDKQREGAEIVHGSEACHRHSVELLSELGFPEGVFPLKDLEECGRVKETGFVWMRQKQPYEHFFKGTGTRVSYAAEVTAYVEKGRMRKIVGIKSRQIMVWVPIAEMRVEEGSRKIHFKTPLGFGRSFPFSAFGEDEGEEEEGGGKE